MTTYSSLFESIGGSEAINRLTEALYKRVGKHPDLIPIFPEDLTETIRKQQLFLTQFLGGPPLYIEEFGHPMLRRRHLPFEITPTRRDAWLACMNGAMDEIDMQEPYRTAIFERLTMTAEHMMNTPEP